jgi:CBS domain containing-hemolysin-like protein
VNPLVLFLIGGCLAVSFLLSGMEAGVFALSRLRIRKLMRAGRTSAKVLHHFLDRPENFLWTILVGNTLVNFAFIGWLFLALQRHFTGQRTLLIVSFGAGVFLFYVLCDLLPKMLFHKFPNRLCMFSAKPFSVLHFALRPLVAFVEGGSNMLLRRSGGKAFTGHLFGNREELRQIMQESSHALSTDERTMINRVLDLQNLTVRQFTTPLDQAVTVDADAPIGDVLQLARDRGRWRFPVWESRAGERRIAGLLTLDALLYDEALDESQPARAYMRPALFLDEDWRLEDALSRMQRSGQRLALVLGPDKRELGLLTLEDILKTLFGEVKL